LGGISGIVLALLHNRTAQSLGGWVGLLTGVFSLLAFLTPEWFGHLTVAQKVFASFGTALGVTPLLAITLAVGAWGYRLLKPFEPAEEEDQLSVAPYDDTELRQQMSSNTEILAAFARDARAINKHR
jgi:hypothetical protein